MEDRNKEEDVDLIIVVEYIKRLLISLFSLIGRLLKDIYFLIKRNILFLVGSVILGFLLSIISIWVRPPSYTTKIDIKTYDGMASGVYNTVDYLNSLIDNEIVFKEIVSKDFTEEDYRKINDLEIHPLYDLKATQSLFDEYRAGLDSSNVNDLSYEDFKERLSDIDYNKHTIVLKSSAEISYKSFYDNLIQYLNEESSAKVVVEKNNVAKKDKVTLIENNIQNLDSSLNVLQRSNAINSSEGLSNLTVFLNTYVISRNSMVNKREGLENDDVYITLLNRYDAYGIRMYKERVIKVTLITSLLIFLCIIFYRFDTYLKSK